MSVRLRGKILYIDFYCYLPGGRKTRCVESTGLTDTQKHRKHAQDKDRTIKFEQSAGTFNYLRHFPHGSKAKAFIKSNSKKTLGALWKEWIKTQDLADNTRVTWNAIFRTHINPELGKISAKALRPLDIQNFQFTLREKGLKAITINNIITTLSIFLNRLCINKEIAENPCKYVRTQRMSIPEIKPFSPEEIRQILQNCRNTSPAWHDLIVFWSMTGLRNGELYALRWDRVDFINKVLDIRESISYSGRTKEPKTGPREVRLRPEALEALRRQQRRSEGQGPFVWRTDTGRQYRASTFSMEWKKQLLAAKIAHRPSYNMRHTYATLSLAAGDNPAFVARQLGHSNMTMTFQRYAKYIPNVTGKEDGAPLSILLFGNNGVTGGDNPPDLLG